MPSAGRTLTGLRGPLISMLHLLGPGVAQRVQQVAVIEADLHLFALALGAELIDDAAQVGLAADDDFTICKTDAEGIF